MRWSALVCLLLLSLAPVARGADVVIPHQGRLLDAENLPVNATLDLKFRIYGSTGGDDQVWEATYNVEIHQGLYAVGLGDTKNGTRPALPASKFAGDRWLTVTIGTVELLPRLRIGMVPNAASAADSASLGGVDAALYATKDYVNARVAAATPVGYAKVADLAALEARAAADYFTNAAHTAYAQAAQATFLNETTGDARYLRGSAGGIEGNLNVSGTIAAGTLTVTNTGKVANLNADAIDGLSGDDLVQAGEASVQVFDTDGHWATGVAAGATVADGVLSVDAPEIGSGELVDFAPTYDQELEGGTYHYRSYRIPAGVRIRYVGARPLVIRATQDIKLDGRLDLSGLDGASVVGSSVTTEFVPNYEPQVGGRAGAGGFNGGTSQYFFVDYRASNGHGPGGGRTGTTGTAGGGGGGAGHAIAGTAGADSSGTAVTGLKGAAGPAYNTADLAGLGLVGGSGGGTGGWGGGANAPGAGGGGGGGGVQLVSPSISVGAAGVVDTRGGSGGWVLGEPDGGCGGGGSGGTIWLRGTAVTLASGAQVLASGGSGGGVSYVYNHVGGLGGAGANGRIRIDAATLTNGGATVTPAAGVTTNAAPAAGASWVSPALAIARPGAKARFLRVDVHGDELLGARYLFRTAAAEAGLASAAYRAIASNGAILATEGHAFGQLSIEGQRGGAAKVDAVQIHWRR